MSKHKIEWDIRSKDGKITEGNEWAKDLAEQIGNTCMEHGKGFVFIPFGGSNLTCKSFFATSLTKPMVFAAAIGMAIHHYFEAIDDPNIREKIVKAIVQTATDGSLDETDD